MPNLSRALDHGAEQHVHDADPADDQRDAHQRAHEQLEQKETPSSPCSSRDSSATIFTRSFQLAPN